MLATALVLQTYRDVSDDEAKQRGKFKADRQLKIAFHTSNILGRGRGAAPATARALGA